jgi:hypothetical protein
MLTRDYHETSTGPTPYTEAEDVLWAAKQAAYQASIFPNAKAAFIRQVKTEAGAITQQVLSGLGSEYELAEKEATTYKAAGYSTEIPNSVQDEIASKAAKGITITAIVACDAILAAAIGWRNSQSELRRNRLITVSAAEIVDNLVDLDVIRVRWKNTTTVLKNSLGL